MFILLNYLSKEINREKCELPMVESKTTENKEIDKWDGAGNAKYHAHFTSRATTTTTKLY